jgi:hypothetical protein
MSNAHQARPSSDNPSPIGRAKPLPRRYYAVIPTIGTLTAAEQAALDAGGGWPVRELEHLPRHETFLDFLIDQGVEAWRHSRGGKP